MTTSSRAMAGIVARGLRLAAVLGGLGAPAGAASKAETTDQFVAYCDQHPGEIPV